MRDKLIESATQVPHLLSELKELVFLGLGKGSRVHLLYLHNGLLQALQDV
jgi:hypothetical protein